MSEAAHTQRLPMSEKNSANRHENPARRCGCRRRREGNTEMALFDKREIQRWRRTVFRELHALGFRSPSDLGAGLVLATIGYFGTDIDVLIEMTGHSREFITKVLRRARKERIVRGQTLAVRWDAEGFEGSLAFALDTMTAAGMLFRPVDQKRSAAQRGAMRKPRGKYRPRQPKVVGAFTPAKSHSNPYYQLEDRRAKFTNQGSAHE